jgi:hypothetical protein
VAALRLIQWTTGKVGKHSLRAIINDPRRRLTLRDVGLPYSPVGLWA